LIEEFGTNPYGVICSVHSTKLLAKAYYPPRYREIVSYEDYLQNRQEDKFLIKQFMLKSEPKDYNVTMIAKS